MKAFIQKSFKNALYGKAYTRSIFTVTGISLKEMRVSFYQFFSWNYPISSFFRAFKYILLGFSRLFMGRSVRVSYAFTAEDRIIESILKPIITYNGFYVDVGCNEPRFISNTFLLYRRGWSGICIDANEALVKKYAKFRPRDKAICALVSDKDDQIEFVEFTNNVLSSVEKANIDKFTGQNQKITKRRWVKPKSLNLILRENNAPRKFDLLSIDVEDHDINVLRSLDFSFYRPKLIVVESETFDLKYASGNEIYNFLTHNNYQLIGYILTNLYFVDEAVTIKVANSNKIFKGND